MQCFLLKNFEKVLNIKTFEMTAFKQCVLNAIETVDNIYLLNLNSSSVNDKFLDEILGVLMKRDFRKAETRRYGPEILDIENLPIKDNGIKSICKYLESNCNDTKWIKIGHFFGCYEMSEYLSNKFINSLDANKHILKLDIQVPVKLHQHFHQKDQIIKRNTKKYRDQKRRKRKMTV